MDSVCAGRCGQPLEEPVFRCFCGEPAWSLTSGTSRNPGRKFYICQKAAVGRGCKFWIWEDVLLRFVSEMVEYSAFGRFLSQLIEADKWPWDFFGQSKPRSADSVCYSRGRRMKAATNENKADQPSSDPGRRQLSLELVTALCLVFKSSVHKATEQVIDSEFNILMERLASLVNPGHESAPREPQSGHNPVHKRAGCRRKVLAHRRRIGTLVPFSTYGPSRTVTDAGDETLGHCPREENSIVLSGTKSMLVTTNSAAMDEYLIGSLIENTLTAMETEATPDNLTITRSPLIAFHPFNSEASPETYVPGPNVSSYGTDQHFLLGPEEIILDQTNETDRCMNVSGELFQGMERKHDWVGQVLQSWSWS